MENFATILKYTWTLINEYRTFKGSDVDEEAQAASLMLKALVKYLTDYTTPAA